MDYIKSDFDISIYWKTLSDNGITKERLLSYDRAIHSEPNFRPDQKDGLLRDLGHYMRTLKVRDFGHICMAYLTLVFTADSNNYLFVCVCVIQGEYMQRRLNMLANYNPFHFT